MRLLNILLLTFLIPSSVQSDTVELCACPTAPCAGVCQTFNTGECQPFYQCFAQVNGLFGYIKPELVQGESNKVLVNVYGESSCDDTKFDAAANGWSGSCNTECWSEVSKIGGGQCTLSTTSSARYTAMMPSLFLLVLVVALN